MSQTSNVRRLVSWVVLAAVIGAGFLVWNNRLALADDIRLWNYTPPANIAALEQQVEFTNKGQRLFYASHPDIEDKATFNDHCQSHEAGQTVLGCYTRESIYLYDVTDTRLNGVMEVTAAHETLHAAYERLSAGERSNVDAMIQREYTTLSTNQAFRDRFSVYDALSQADKLNELHSIFGTEVASLSPELETYYQQYFKDRSVITADYASYQGAFDTLKAQQTTLKSQIDALQSQIASLKAQYQADRTALQSDIQAFNAKASAGGYTSQTQFNSDRAALAARSNALAVRANDINTKVDTYNDDITQYNALSVQTQDLQNSLDSNAVQDAPSV